MKSTTTPRRHARSRQLGLVLGIIALMTLTGNASGSPGIVQANGDLGISTERFNIALKRALQSRLTTVVPAKARTALSPRAVGSARATVQRRLLDATNRFNVVAAASAVAEVEPPAEPMQSAGNPILLVTIEANKFSKYLRGDSAHGRTQRLR